MDEQAKKGIIESSRHQFIYGKNTKERQKFLECIDSEYKIKANVNTPMGIYLSTDLLLTSETMISANGDMVRLQSFAREQLSFTLAVMILKKIKRDLEAELGSIETNLLNFVNSRYLERTHRPIEIFDELITAFQKSADFYKENFLKEIREEKPAHFSFLQVPFLDIISFVRSIKKVLKNDSYFAILIDHQSKLSTFSYQAVNNLIGGRINSDLSIKVVSEPEDWQVYFDMGGNRIDAVHDYGTEELDDSLKRHIEKQKRAIYGTNPTELGGFAESADDIDGDEDEFEAFNCCLANDYVTAIINEDFESLGELEANLLETIAYWATKNDTDDEIIKHMAEITKGLIITYKGRTFAEAVIENQNANAAFTLILNGNHDPRLYMTVILYEDVSEGFDSLLNQIHSSFIEPDVDRYCNFLECIFSQIDTHYDSLENAEQRLEFLIKIRPYIAGIRIPVCYKDSVRLKNIAAMKNKNWQIQLRKRMTKQK